MAPKGKRSRRERSSSRSSRVSSSSSGSRTPPPRETRKRSRHSSGSSRSRTVEVEVLREALSSLLMERRPRTPLTSTFGGDSVPPFNPEDASLSIDAWCSKVDELRNMYRWSEEATIYFALSKLRGLAVTWHKSLPTGDHSWEEWKTKLTQAFPSKRNYSRMLKDMLSRRKRPDETYVRYYYEKLGLVNICNISERYAVSCIIDGISEPHVYTAANAGNHADPGSVFSYLSTLDDDKRPNTSTETRPPSNVPTWKKKVHHREHGQFKSKHRQPQRPAQEGAFKCYACGKSGHISARCPYKKDLICKKCGKNGHQEDRCYSNPKTVA